jgi:hypothetical protein
VSVDGFIEGPTGEFIGPTWSADLDRWTFDMIDRFDPLLYGRIAWQGMAAYWREPSGVRKCPKRNENWRAVHDRTTDIQHSGRHWCGRLHRRHASPAPSGSAGANRLRVTCGSW